MMQGEDDPYNLRPLKDELLKIYEVFRGICDRHRLKFFAVGGTSIGAVRHRGFIPWDDDLDVAMPRQDYEVFLSIAGDELPENYKIVNWRNTPEMAPMMLSKIQETRREVVEHIESVGGRSLPQGIYIDIFPMDGVLKSPFLRRANRLLGLILTLMLCSYKGFEKRNLRSVVARTLGYVLRACLLFLPSCKSVSSLFERSMRFVDFGDSDVFEYAPNVRSNKFPYACIGNTRYLPFENTQMRVPDDVDMFLRHRFGDYMKLPPKDMQKPTHGENILAPWKFGPTNR